MLPWDDPARYSGSMNNTARPLLPWARFAGCVLLVAVLKLGQAVIVPVALALLFAFVLSPVVSFLQRVLGRVLAVLVVVLLTFTLLGTAGYVTARQLSGLALELPAYQQNIRQKIRDIRWIGRGGSVEKLQSTVESLKAELQDPPKGTITKPVVVQPLGDGTFTSLPTTLNAAVEGLATAGLVVALVIFMLLERQELRTRLVSLFGRGRLAVATRALDEAGMRVSRYLLTQSLINLAFGVGVAIGLTLIGLPYVLLWASLAAVLRFIPYVGPWVGALSPLLVSLAVFSDWTRPLLVMGLFLALELFTNLVLETVFYAGAAGVSQTALITAVAFWTWLWGPVGLLMATPLTVCLVVIGKYVPGFDFVTLLMSDEPVVDPASRLYERLLAGDQAEGWALIDAHVRQAPAETVYDALLLSALRSAEHDRAQGRLTDDEERAIVASTGVLLTRLTQDHAAGAADDGEGKHPGAGSVTASIAVLGMPASGESDVLALRMLAGVLGATSFELAALSQSILAAEAVALVQKQGYRAVCIADLSSSRPTRVRYVVRRLRAAFPEVRIIVGRWAAVGPDGAAELTAAGADAVTTTLLETRSQLCRLFSVAEPEAAPLSAENRPTNGSRASQVA